MEPGAGAGSRNRSRLDRLHNTAGTEALEHGYWVFLKWRNVYCWMLAHHIARVEEQNEANQ